MRRKDSGKRKNIKRIAGLALFIAVIAGIVHVSQQLFANDGSSESVRLQGFYMEEPDSLDIVVMGASEIMNDYCAPEVYRKHGYTSYPYAFAVNSVPLWKYELAEIERTQHPQVLIIEANGALYTEDKLIDSKDCVRLLGDNMPVSENCIRYAFEKTDHPMETIFPVLKYHYRWSDIGDESVKDRLLMMQNGYARLRGAMTPLYHTEFSSDNVYPADGTTAALNEKGEAELRAFLKVCKESEIPHIVFAEFPHILDTEKAYYRHQRANRAAEIIQEEGFDYIDFTREIDAIGLEYQEDFFDTHHMVATGQRKLSDYIGKTVRDRYGITPKPQSDENRATWEDSAELIESFYRCYEEYTQAHSDKPHEEVDHDLSDTRRTIEELDAMGR